MTDTRSDYDATRLRAVFEGSFTYAAGFARNTHRFASRPALRDPETDRSWTYAALGADVDRVAGWLVRHGAGRGSVVMVELANSPEFAIVYLACHRIGAVFSPTNYRLAPEEVAFIVDDSAPVVLVHDAARTEVLAAALRAADHHPDHVVTVGGEDDGFADLLAADPVTAEELAATEPRSTWDETTRLYTSGTTGRPKPVPLPSLVEVLSAHDVVMHFPLGPFDKTLNMSPLFHRGGLYSGGPNPVFYVGAELTTLRQFDAERVLDLVETEHLTFLIGAPTNLVQLADAQERRPRDLSSLHGIVTMGAPLDRAAALRYQELLTPRIFNGYGTTETFWNTFLRPEDLPEGAGSTGRASTDDDIAVVRVYDDRLADPTDVVAQDGTEVGEFAVRTVKSGYSYRNPGLEAEKFADGWFYPGDLATWDEHERVTIVGRKDDMIISGGENVHPVQVEAALQEHPGVADAIVVGVPDERWGQVVVAYVVRAAGRLPEDDREAVAVLEEWTGSHPGLARFKRPRRYRFVDELPYNATGKKVHYLAAQRAAEDDAAGLLIGPVGRPRRRRALRPVRLVDVARRGAPEQTGQQPADLRADAQADERGERGREGVGVERGHRDEPDRARHEQQERREERHGRGDHRHEPLEQPRRHEQQRRGHARGDDAAPQRRRPAHDRVGGDHDGDGHERQPPAGAEDEAEPHGEGDHRDPRDPVGGHGLPAAAQRAHPGDLADERRRGRIDPQPGQGAARSDAGGHEREHDEALHEP